jgi:hypothetical protein
VSHDSTASSAKATAALSSAGSLGVTEEKSAAPSSW